MRWGLLGVLLLLGLTLPLEGQFNQVYVGAKACAACHESAYRQWSESRHSKMVHPATAQSVEGNFALGKVVLLGSTYLLQHRGGHYYITESDLAGKPWEHQVDYTLGGRRLQQYLTTLRDGRILLLPITWDNVHQKWLKTLDVDNPEEAGDPVQIWNKSCYSCHVTAGQKNFDLQLDRYHTTWKDFGISCESCHGPGSKHAAQVSGSEKPEKANKRAAIDRTIVNPAQLDATRSTMVCAQCHSLRDVYASDSQPGGNYYDFFMPVMEYRLRASKDPAYWPDGRPRWFANEAFGWWQSECFLKGRATCLTCHSHPHNMGISRNPQLRASDNALCTQCHTAIAANISAHTHHATNSRGSSCIECHMPSTVVSIHARMRDHAISIPVPENTIRHGIPNACNLCHTDKSAEWALQKVSVWYGEKSGQRFVRRADAFSEARNGDSAAIPALLQILSDSAGGPLIRANAAGYLGSFPGDPSAYAAVLRCLSDAQPLVRATAALAIRPRAALQAALAPQVASLLSDPVTIVRVSAAIALVAMGVHHIPGEDGMRFERAKALYRARAEIDADDADQQLAAGKFFFLAGDPDDAVAAFRATLKLDPSIPAQNYLAEALAQKRDFRSAEEILKAIPRDDLQYEAAQRLLAQIELKNAEGGSAGSAMSAPAQDSSAAQAAFLEGQLLYENRDYVNALRQLEQALQLAPQASWATRAQIDRAVCLEKLARTSEAETAMRSLSDNDAARHDVDLQLAFVELLYQTGRPEEALQRVRRTDRCRPQSSYGLFLASEGSAPAPPR